MINYLVKSLLDLNSYLDFSTKRERLIMKHSYFYITKLLNVLKITKTITKRVCQSELATLLMSLEDLVRIIFKRLSFLNSYSFYLIFYSLIHENIINVF